MAGEILNDNVDELKQELEEYEGDFKQLLEKEREGKDRKTAKEAIKKYIDESDLKKDGSDAGFGMGDIKSNVQDSLEADEDDSHEVRDDSEFVKTGISGFDNLFEHGIPKGSPVVISGGPGSGKTIFTLQTMQEHASNGDECLYISFEESEEDLTDHMKDFGWEPEPMIEEGNLKIIEYSTFDIKRQVEAMVAEQRGELMIDVEPVIIPEDCDPEFIVIDSLTAIESSFAGKKESYRIYMKQLFKFLKKSNATSFLITETKEEEKNMSAAAVDEFLADGVIILYNLKKDGVRQRAAEILKMRGAKHDEKMAAMNITENGIKLYPDQKPL